MKTINVVVESESVGLQLFDKTYAYLQNLRKDYKSKIIFKFNNKKETECFNIFYSYMPIGDLNPNEYDLVLHDNAEEPLGTVSTSTMIKNMNNENVYTQCNSVFHEEKNIDASKIINFFGDIEKIIDYYNRPFYPQYYSKISQIKPKSVIFMNGKNRSNRNYFLEKIKKANIPYKNNISDVIHETNDSLIESGEDAKFREYLNETYNISRNVDTDYYSNSIECGINAKFGSIPPGYFLTDAYNQYKVIAFPESTWINDELSITEKSLKCFIAGNLPFPVGGRHVNTLYNRLGFTTAYNFLPERLKEFDFIENHIERYDLMVESLKWLEKNISNSEKFQYVIEKNRRNLYSRKFSSIGVKHFIDIIEKL